MGFNLLKKKKKNPSRTVEPKQQNKRISKLEIIIRYRPNFLLLCDNRPFFGGLLGELEVFSHSAFTVNLFLDLLTQGVA